MGSKSRKVTLHRSSPMSSTRVISVLLTLSLLLHAGSGWRQWEWFNSTGPGARRGHSMAFYKSQLIVFGGRTEDTYKTHTPKTYETRRVNGTLEFLSYDDKPVKANENPQVRVGVYFNDIWSYDINCTRYADASCVDKTWINLDPGADWGGCKIVLGAHMCSHPSERWFHRAEVFDDETMLIYGGFSPLCEDYCNDMWLFDFTDNSWTEMMEIGNTAYGPGKRFKFSSAVRGSKMYIFGGFRLWHGYAHENSVENDWSDFSRYPKGGYLNDLWVYDKTNNTWTNLTEKLSCAEPSPLERSYSECVVTWPSPRAGHASVIYQDALYVHGGYQTFFPYPATNGRGAGRGTLTIRDAGFTPYPSNPYYLSDLWKFNQTTGLWTQILMDPDVLIPSPRMDHVMVAVKDVFFVFGGYLTNYFYDDTWQYNTTSNRWLEQKTFVHAQFPANCTDDLQNRKNEHSGTYRKFVAPKNVPEEDGYTFVKERHYGTLLFSVFADPSRGLGSDQELIPQARRQAPGWDGCRDRYDGRKDLPQGLQWAHPSQRAGHMVSYHEELGEFFIYGGYGFKNETLYQRNVTLEANSLYDLWQYNPNNCPQNCSLHGHCHFGKCRCDDGYYGVDCSNSTCPGSFCYYDELTQEQVCSHCCFSGFEHTENDSYVSNIQKYPCELDNLHSSNGICDGFGMCLCKTGFIGQDCSIRDCNHNCSGHGYCSVEFPNSRCMCDDGWFGKYCELKMCLNNCSYPNGQCVNGSCYCSMVYEPYNNTLQYLPLMGEDCSFLIPFAGTKSLLKPLYGLCLVLFSALVILLS